MSKTPNRSGSIGLVGALAMAFAAAFAGCATKHNGDGSESHFLCQTDADCASHGDGLKCEATRCVSVALETDGAAPGSGGTTSTGGATSGGTGGFIDIGGPGGRGPATNGGSATGNGGDVGAAVTYDRCTGACCPADSACYSTPAGKNSPGAECLATQDNTGQLHVQLRQQWTRATTPAGSTVPLFYAVMAGRSQLPWKACNQTGPLGSGGFIELADYFLGGADKSKHYATVGYATFVPGPALGVNPATFVPTATLQNGFCFGTETYAGGPAVSGIDYGLTAAEVGDGAGYPDGLPPPMAVKVQPWTVKPTTYKRLDSDFDLGAGATRTDLLTKLAPTGQYGRDGFGGAFYYDDATGTTHGFATLRWMVVYGPTGSSHIDVPMREVETRSRFNEASHPNCVGAYLPDTLDPTTCYAGSDPTLGGWGGGDCTVTTGNANCAPGDAPASTTGYYLIAELEQVYSPDLQNTLCVVYPGNDAASNKPIVDAQGFYDQTRSSCKTASWNPSDPVNGLPMGDWCAKTNAAATADCHDAWRARSYQVFAGAKIQLDGIGAPKSCPLQP